MPICMQYRTAKPLNSYTFEASQEQCGFLGAHESHDLRISFTLASGLSHS